jgi:COMPASS component SWD1
MRKQVDEDISVDVTTCDSIQAFLDSDEEEDRDEVFYLSSLPFEDNEKDVHNTHDEEYVKKSFILKNNMKKKKKFDGIDDRSKKALKKF